MFKWFMAFTFPTLVLAYSPTPESSCTPLDLRNSTLGEVRNQKEISWCYSFTGADMLGHTFGIQEKLSAADIAIGYNDTKFGKIARWLDINVISRGRDELRLLAHQTGFNKVALKTAMKNGWCPESVFPSEEWIKMSREGETWIEDRVPVKTAMFEIAALHQQRQALTAQNIPYYFSFKNVDAQTFVDLLQTKKIAGFYSGLRKAVCRDDRRPFDYRWKTKMVFKNRKIFKRVSEQLERGRLVGLDYDSRIIKDRTNRGVKLSELHTSSLVGRRWNSENQSCEYLLRNSWGDVCDERYDSTYECIDGQVWLSESLIYPNMTSIVYMLSAPAPSN